jgi:hypothetical protein
LLHFNLRFFLGKNIIEFFSWTGTTASMRKKSFLNVFGKMSSCAWWWHWMKRENWEFFTHFQTSFLHSISIPMEVSYILYEIFHLKNKWENIQFRLQKVILMCQVNTQHFLPFFHQMIDCILSFLKKYKFSPIWNEFKLLRMMLRNEMKMRNEMLSMRKSNVIFLFVNSFNKHFISWISIYLLTFSLFHFISQTLFIFFNIHKDCVRRKGKWKKKSFS